MRVLCLADLHRLEFDRLAMQEQDRWISSLLVDVSPDAVVIVGDVFEETSVANPYAELGRLFGDVPVICTLGNHEFYGSTVKQVLERYRELHAPRKWNVHYLDVVGAFDLDHVRFFGNVLWYDGSLSTIPGQVLTDFAGGTWRDAEILGFDPPAEHRRCVDQIMRNQPSADQTGVLCTHCVPHQTLNGHMVKGASPYNAFSGVTDLLGQVRCGYAVCGHTHWRIEDLNINGKRGWNVGNNYVPPFRHTILEIPAVQGEIGDPERQLAETRIKMAGYLEELGLAREANESGLSSRLWTWAQTGTRPNCDRHNPQPNTPLSRESRWSGTAPA